MGAGGPRTILSVGRRRTTNEGFIIRGSGIGNMALSMSWGLPVLLLLMSLGEGIKGYNRTSRVIVLRTGLKAM